MLMFFAHATLNSILKPKYNKNFQLIGIGEIKPETNININ